MSAKKTSFKGTYLFTALVACLAAYSGWTFYRTGSDNDTATEKRLFHFQAPDVEELKITGKDQDIDVVREGDGWKIKAPYQDLGEPSALDAVLYSITIQKGRAFRGEGEDKKVNWAEFGFEPPRALVEVRTKAGTEKLEVGTKNAFDGSFYLRQNGELLLGDKSLAQAVLRDPKTYRSRRIFRDPDADPVAVEVTRGKERYTLTKNGEAWTIEPKPAFPVDKSKIAKWIANLEQVEPSEVAAETLSEDGKRNFLLLKPSAVITVKFKKADGKPAPDWVLTIGQNKDEDVYLKTNTLAPVYKTAASVMDTYRAGPEAFRDGTKPFHFDIEPAREVDVHDGAFNHKFLKSDLVWKLKDEPKHELNQDKLISLMQKVANLSAGEFLPAKAGKGFKADQSLEVRDDKGKILFSMQWGDAYIGQISYNKGQSYRFVKTSLQPGATLGVPATKWNGLFDKAMVHDKVEKK